MQASIITPHGEPTPGGPALLGQRSEHIVVQEETLVTDSRAGLTPSQCVEHKLIHLLKASPLLLSHVQTTRRPRR